MTINLNSLQSIVNSAVTSGVDQTKAERRVPMLLPAGDYIVYMTEYVETGLHLPEFQGKPTGKPAAVHVRIGFCIIDAQNPNGVHHLRLQEMPISQFERSTFHRLFKSMQAADNTVKHMAQFLGKAFYGKVEEYISKEGRISNVLDKFSLKPVPKFHPMSGAPINVTPLNSEQEQKLLKLFLWNNPTKATWESLHIEKKNFIQERCMQSLDINESKLMSVLYPAPDMDSMFE